MTAALTTVGPRLSRLIRLLGSDQDGEVVAAARALGRTLESVGEDFHTLAAIVERSAAPAVPPAAHRGCGDPRAMARWILKNSGAYLSPKEFSFIADMSKRLGSLSERQRAWLQALYERAAAQSRRA